MAEEEKSDMKKATKIPILIGVVVMVLSFGMFGWKGYQYFDMRCDQKKAEKDQKEAEKKESALRKAATNEAMRHLCRKKDIHYLSGNRSSKIYRLRVCGVVRWYKCWEWGSNISPSCDELKKGVYE